MPQYWIDVRTLAGSPVSEETVDMPLVEARSRARALALGGEGLRVEVWAVETDTLQYDVSTANAGS